MFVNISLFLSLSQVCAEKRRFEKLMEYFRKEESNIDFMVNLESNRDFSKYDLPYFSKYGRSYAYTTNKYLEEIQASKNFKLFWGEINIKSEALKLIIILIN